MAARALFSGWEKRAAFELLKTPRFRNTMSLWCNSFHVSEPLHEECEAFVCALYRKTSFLNCAAACSAQRLAELANFPHSEMLCGITRCVPSTKPPSGGESWRPSQISRTPVAMDGHQTPLVCCPFRMDQLPAPQALLEMVSCGCITGCATRRCTCKTMACLALMCASAPGMKCSH